jgi:cysteine-rich repeat protein
MLAGRGPFSAGRLWRYSAAMSARLRFAALLALAPFVAGAHCREDCGPPAVRLVGGRQLERTLYGVGIFTIRSGSAPLAASLASFERRELRVDVSRPVVVLLVEAGAARALARGDGARLHAGDRGEGYRVLATVEQKGKVSLFEDAAALAEAERERYDAVMLLAKDRSATPLEASVAIDVGRRSARRNDPETGRCVDVDRSAAALPEFSLIALPPGCGDGVRQSDEDCDDGNRRAGDGCSPYCVRER